MLKNVRFGNVVLAVVALLTGWLTLLTLLVDGLADLRQVLLGWGALLMAVAVMAGVFNLLRVHLNRLVSQGSGWYSIFMVLGFGITLILGLLPYFGENGPIARETQIALNDFPFRHIIAPTSAALSALLLFVLVFAGMRLLRRRPSFLLLVFLATAVLAVFNLGPSLFAQGELQDLGTFWAKVFWPGITQVLAVAGARGLLIGMALGVLATGLRVLLALDRPYGD
ncbi:MAG: hypothetical protein JNL09_00835 [Anaerolineales bacterium]|nr:hypothetical protein [Anaerolineales bacterium]